MKNLLVVRTTYRPNGALYLDETLTRLDAEGASEADSKLVFCDGAPNEPIKLWRYAVSPFQEGTRRSLWKIFQIALDDKVDQALLFEDDVWPARNAVRLMTGLAVPSDLAFLSFFDSYECPQGAPYGVYPKRTSGSDGWGFRYSQCVLIPNRTMRFLVDHFPEPRDIAIRVWSSETGESWRKGDKNRADNAIGYALAKSPWPQYGVFVPSLVRHIGFESAAAPGPFDERKIERNFPGNDFDALSLLPRSP